MAASKGVTRANWNLVPGQADDASNDDNRLPKEYFDQIGMDVHYVGGAFADGDIRKIDSLTGQESAHGQDRFVHLTACGIVVGSELIRSSDDASEITCAKCKPATKRGSKR